MKPKSWDEIRAQRSRRRPYTQGHESHLPEGFDPFADAGTLSVRNGSQLRAESRSSTEEALERVRRTQRLFRAVRIARISLGAAGVLIALYLGATKG